MASLIQHVHDFARENEITVDEWMAGLELVRLVVSSNSRLRFNRSLYQGWVIE